MDSISPENNDYAIVQDAEAVLSLTPSRKLDKMEVELGGDKVYVSSLRSLSNDVLREEIKLSPSFKPKFQLIIGSVIKLPHFTQNIKSRIYDWAVDKPLSPQSGWVRGGTTRHYGLIYDDSSSIALAADNFDVSTFGFGRHRLNKDFEFGVFSNPKYVDEGEEVAWTIFYIPGDSPEEVESRTRELIPAVVSRYPGGHKAALAFSLDFECAIDLMHSPFKGKHPILSSLSRLAPFLKNLKERAEKIVEKRWAVKTALRARRNSLKIIEHSEEYNIPITWFVGLHGILRRCDGHDAGIYEWANKNNGWGSDFWTRRDWMSIDPCSDAQKEPAWYLGDIVVDCILNSKVGHEVGCHTSFHTDATLCTRQQFTNELNMWEQEARKIGVQTKSFAFPFQRMNKYDLLGDHFICFRGYDGERFPKANLYLSPPMEWRKNLVSIWLSEMQSDFEELEELVNEAIRRGGVCCIYMHPHEPSEREMGILRKLFLHASKKRDDMDLLIATFSKLAEYWIKRGDTRCRGYFDDENNLHVEIKGEKGFAPTICTYFSTDASEALSVVDEDGSPIPYTRRAETGELFILCPPLREKKKKITLSRVK